ncbi:MAG: BMP family ABC transporter substrate-binding protein [Anaerolineaceae bacterium]|nr:BMP family ABC transporter substrate-binding protein [Anaerolineaceae bacterium]
MNQSAWIGKTLSNRYKIEELLGQGGMSSVYKAFDPNLKRVVAIKMVHPHLSNDKTFLTRFEEEATAIANIRHPNIVQVFDFNTDQDLSYMVMEYVPGETLQSRLKRLNNKQQKMPVDEALKITMNVCDGLSYAHKRGMVHRDVKPANIMLDIQNQAILMDFGIVKIVGSAAHTLTGAVIGTANYMPPEIIRSEPADQRSDIYALGVTLFEMLSGKPPFEADSAMTIMLMHLNDSIPDIQTIRDDLPKNLNQVLMKALEKDRIKRYQTADEFSADLRKVFQIIESKEILLPLTEQKLKTDDEIVIPTEILSPVIGKEDDVTVVDYSIKQTFSESTPATLVVPPEKTKKMEEQIKETNSIPLGLVIGLAGLLVVVIVVVGGFVLNWFGFGAEVIPTEQIANAVMQPTDDSLDSTRKTSVALSLLADKQTQEAKKQATPELVVQNNFKVCQLTSSGGIDDQSFNATVWKGIERAEIDLGVVSEFLESKDPSEYEQNMISFIDKQCDLIVSTGFQLGDITTSFAQTYPDYKFTVVDYPVEPEIPNLVGQQFQIDEATFLAGYLAARMTQTGKVATFGGMPLPPVQMFMDGFARGVSYYNNVYGTEVQVIGWDINNPEAGLFVGSFEDRKLGADLANELINQGVDVILPVAGEVGFGSAAVMVDLGSGVVIGVDSDWAINNPEFAGVILTSVLKNSDNTTYQIIKNTVGNQFEGSNFVGRLINDGVGLAPIRDFEERISAEFLEELMLVREKIISGEIILNPDFRLY